MNGWLLDTNVTAELISPRGSARVKAWAVAQPEASLFLSILTIAEYDKGIANLPENDGRRDRFEQDRDRLARRFGDRLLPLDNAIVRRWGVLSGTIRRRTGHPPPVIDTLLAATALEHRLVLTTRNVKDVRQSGAVVFDPWIDSPADYAVGVTNPPPQA